MILSRRWEDMNEGNRHNRVLSYDFQALQLRYYTLEYTEFQTAFFQVSVSFNDPDVHVMQI
jgi:hypothetical protein